MPPPPVRHISVFLYLPMYLYLCKSYFFKKKYIIVFSHFEDSSDNLVVVILRILKDQWEKCFESFSFFELPVYTWLFHKTFNYVTIHCAQSSTYWYF
jgi:hypothetical protein